MVEYNNPLPDTPEDWLKEIAKAYVDIIDENQFNEIMEYIETEEYRINSMID